MSENQPQSAEAVLAAVRRLLEGSSLTETQAKDFFTAIVQGEVSDIHIAAALSAIKVRTQSAEELAGAAMALLDSSTEFPSPCLLYTSPSPRDRG